MRKIRFPILRNSYNVYSPLVFSGGDLISPWTSDVVVYPSRNITINRSLGTHFSDAPGHSEWPYYLNSNSDAKLKVISAFVDNNNNPYYYSMSCSHNVGRPTSTNWAQHYYNGYEFEYDTGQGYHSNGNHGGVFWNMNNFSGMNVNTNQIKCNFGAVVSLQHEMFEENNVTYQYNWGAAGLGAGHIYNNTFNLSVNKSISTIDITGTLQPIPMVLNISIKGSNYVPNGNKESGTIGLGSFRNSLSNNVKQYTLSASLNSTVTGSNPVKYLSNNDGIVRHFLYNNDGYDYFAVDGIIDLSAAFENTTMSGVASPIFSLTPLTSDQGVSTGATWTNATAVATCSDGTVSRKTGTFYLSPSSWNTMDWLESMGIRSNFYIDDLKFGFSAVP